MLRNVCRDCGSTLLKKTEFKLMLFAISLSILYPFITELEVKSFLLVHLLSKLFLLAPVCFIFYTYLFNLDSQSKRLQHSYSFCGCSSNSGGFSLVFHTSVNNNLLF